jgi:hypothetical protein
MFLVFLRAWELIVIDMWMLVFTERGDMCGCGWMGMAAAANTVVYGAEIARRYGGGERSDCAYGPVWCRRLRVGAGDWKLMVEVMSWRYRKIKFW